jgi:N-acetylglucosaminyldiphosphoundecaprenol N-acetyl-beta-D-mannosaminyltransferase
MEYCDIFGTHVNLLDMDKTKRFVYENLDMLRGEYICVSNVHTTVMAYDDISYRNVQNEAALRLPDGGPLSWLCRRRGHSQAQRVTGPDFMKEVFQESTEHRLRMYFYGGKPDVLEELREKLAASYPDMVIAGMYSPPFRKLTEEEDCRVIEMINAAKPDIVWVGLGAPKQENWMHEHKGKITGLMIGVGAGFDYFAGRIRRAPMWMQKMNLEWLYRFLQDPRRLFKRYLVTNTKFIYLVVKETICGNKHKE